MGAYATLKLARLLCSAAIVVVAAAVAFYHFVPKTPQLLLLHAVEQDHYWDLGSAIRKMDGICISPYCRVNKLY
jgi:hypothetical protein